MVKKTEAIGMEIMKFGSALAVIDTNMVFKEFDVSSKSLKSNLHTK